MHSRAMAGVAALRGLTMVTLFLGGLGLDRGTTASEAEAPAELWTRERIDGALQSLDRMKADGLITERQLQRKRTMLEERRAGRFKSTALSETDPAEFNFLQNAGFEEVNKNSAPNRSRWLWWVGWSWGGDYENFWETRKEYVHSGDSSAGIRCTGKPGRIGLNTPKLPLVPGVKEYEFTVSAKGEGENQLFLNFEAGATGTLRKKVGSDWEQVRLKGVAVGLARAAAPAELPRLRLVPKPTDSVVERRPRAQPTVPDAAKEVPFDETAPSRS